ncbi:ATP-binding protein [Streptomyces sp. NPDC093510]|uniref:ATP-binding protein n=1 Tax=Streptomyces sp. NPDC093510 TaxID=3155199 RepID=UPI0034185D33
MPGDGDGDGDGDAAGDEGWGREGEGNGTSSLPPLMGRAAQLAVIDAALAGIRSTGTSVILRGDPGTGRTALLRSAEETARRAGLRVLRMTGAEAESGLPFAALHQVLWPLLADARGLTEEQRRALESALGIREEAPPEGFTVASAALTLLAHAAARRPVVVLLDDLQWADPSSIAVFGYVQRHLAPLPVVAIGATRRAGDTAGRAPAAAREKRDATQGPPGQVIELPPLDAAQAERLLRKIHPSLPEGARRRVLRAAGGNPLALHELPEQLRRLTADRAEFLAGPTPPRLTESFDTLPLGERLGRLYEDRLRALPDAARSLLLVAALGDASTRDGTVLRDMADREPGTPWSEVRDDIENSGLAHTDPESGRVAFHHPLVRACLVHIASPAERRAAHRLLADALPARSPRRALHLAAATLGTDGELAALLHAEADSMAAQGGDPEAAELMARAARLSPDPASRTARLVGAAAIAVRSGRPHLAAELVAEAETEACPGKPEPAAPYAFAVACSRLQLDADPNPSIELLPAVLDAPPAPEGEDERAALREPMLFLLLVAAALTGDERAWAAVERHAPHASPAAALCRDAWAGPGRADSGRTTGQGRALHEVPLRLREMVAALPSDRETTAAWLLLWAATAVDAVGEHDALWSAFARRHAYATQTFIDSLGGPRRCPPRTLGRRPHRLPGGRTDLRGARVRAGRDAVPAERRTGPRRTRGPRRTGRPGVRTRHARRGPGPAPGHRAAARGEGAVRARPRSRRGGVAPRTRSRAARRDRRDSRPEPVAPSVAGRLGAGRGRQRAASGGPAPPARGPLVRYRPRIGAPHLPGDRRGGPRRGGGRGQGAVRGRVRPAGRGELALPARPGPPGPRRVAPAARSSGAGG